MLFRSLLGFTLFTATAARLLAAEPVRAIPAVSRVEVPSASGEKAAPVISTIAITADGQTLATAGDDHCVRLWNAQDGRLLHVLRGHRDWVRTVGFTPDGKLLVSAGDDRMPLVWQASDGQLLRSLTVAPAAIYSVALSPDGKSVAVSGFCRQIDIHDVATGAFVKATRTDCHELPSLAYSPDGRQLVAGGRPGKLIVCDVASGKQVTTRPTSLKRIRAITWSPDGDQIAVAGDGPAIELWNPHDWQLVRRMASPTGSTRAATFCTDGILATGGTDNQIRLWNTQADSTPRSLSGHVGSVTALAFHPMLGRLVSGGYDTRIRVWRMDQPVEQARTEPGRLR